MGGYNKYFSLLENIKILFENIKITKEKLSHEQSEKAGEIAERFISENKEIWTDISDERIYENAESAIDFLQLKLNNSETLEAISKSISKYLKKLSKKEQEVESRKISRDLLEGLIKEKFLTQWSKKEIETVINFYHKKYFNLEKATSNPYAAYDRLRASYERIAEYYPVDKRKPEFFIDIAKQFFELQDETDKNWKDHIKDINKIINKYKTQDEKYASAQIKNSKKTIKTNIANVKLIHNIKKVSIDDDESINNQFVDELFYSIRDDIGLNSKLSKIDRFINEILKISKLSKQEEKLFYILIDIVKDPDNKAKTQKEIMDLCKKELISQGIRCENYRAIKKRLFDDIKV